jgi:hypothetical protein
MASWLKCVNGENDEVKRNVSFVKYSSCGVKYVFVYVDRVSNN